MLDWKKLARERLGSLPLDESKRDEIVEELAQQLEAAYQDELARGTNPIEAARRSVTQFQDWEELRGEIFRSASGARLPIWQQKGILSPRRPVVWVALAVSLAFLAVPCFQKALHITPFAAWPDAWSSSAFSSRALQRIEKSRDTNKYARSLAYVALHSPDERQSTQAAERAMALDPQLTWICAKMSRTNFPPPGYDSGRWIQRLEAWDPENAYVYLLAAGVARNSGPSTHSPRYAPFTADLRHALFADPGWRASMEQAFSAKRWDIYALEEYALDRQVLLENGLDRPDMLLSASAALPIPNSDFLQMYADDVAEQEEQAGHPEQVLVVYSRVASIAHDLSAGSTDGERFAAARLAKGSSKQVTRILRSLGRNVGSDPVVLTLASIPASDPRTEFNRLLDSPACRAGRIVGLSSAAFLALACLSALWLVCILALRVQPGLSRFMNSVARALSWAPLFLPLSCLEVFLTFSPYVRSLADYGSPQALHETLGAFFIGAFYLRYSVLTNIWIQRMFWPTLWCALVCLFGLWLLFWVRSRRGVNHSAAE